MKREQDKRATGYLEVECQSKFARAWLSRTTTVSQQFQVTSSQQEYLLVPNPGCTARLNENGHGGFIYVRPFVQIFVIVPWESGGSKRVPICQIVSTSRLTDSRQIDRWKSRSDKAETSSSTSCIRHEEFPIMCFDHHFGWWDRVLWMMHWEQKIWKELTFWEPTEWQMKDLHNHSAALVNKRVSILQRTWFDQRCVRMVLSG